MRILVAVTTTLAFIFLVIVEVSSQSVTFSYTYSTEYDDIPIAAMETSNGDFIIVGRQGVYPPSLNSDHVLLLKINAFGDTIKSTLISKPGGNCYINTLLADTGGQFFGIGSSRQTPDEMSVWLIKMDEDLSLLWERHYQTGCQYLGLVQGLKNSFNELVMYGDGYTGVVTFQDLFICKTTLEGDPLFFQFYPSGTEERAWAMTENPFDLKYYLINTGRYLLNTNTYGQLLSIGYNMIVDSIIGIPGNFFLYYNLMMIDGNMLMTGIQVLSSLQPPLPANLLGIEIVDTGFSIVYADTLGSMYNDTLSYPGYITNIDTGLTNRIWFGGTFHQDNYLIFSPFDSWILLTNYDYNLNINWQKFYGGDLYYGLWGVRATSDGGCLLLCTTFDDQIQYEERDILIMKVDSNGVITDNKYPPLINSQDAILYPNPGSDYCLAILCSQHPEATLFLYDLNGRPMVVKELHQPKTRINSESLPSGTYIYRFIANGKVIGTGKWVKQ